VLRFPAHMEALTGIFYTTVLVVSRIGGATVDEAAKIFISVLENLSTRAQKEVAIANAAMALYCAIPGDGVESAVAQARESLESGKALNCFKTLINI